MPGRAALGHCWVEQLQVPLACSGTRASGEKGAVLYWLFVLFPVASSVIFSLKGYVAERKGEREEMQDAHVILNDITAECQPPSTLM